MKSLAKYLDWVSVLSVDYAGYWDGATGHVAPLIASADEQYQTANTVSEEGVFFLLTERTPKTK